MAWCPSPTSNQLASIAISSAATHEALVGERASVAMLSYSSKGSAAGPRVERVRAATEIVRRRAPLLAIDGELQFDAAWAPEVARRKAPDSEVAGEANVFVFPDLDSGNIAYKITERLGGARAYGPLLQGTAGRDARSLAGLRRGRHRGGGSDCSPARLLAAPQ